jgi:hypothetical protein
MGSVVYITTITRVLVALIGSGIGIRIIYKLYQVANDEGDLGKVRKLITKLMFVAIIVTCLQGLLKFIAGYYGVS